MGNMKDLDKALEIGEEVVQSSRQPKNNPLSSESASVGFFSSVMEWVKKAELEPPPYSPNSNSLDNWLRKFYLQEPHLAGVVTTSVSLDVNRGWTLIGGRNQILRYSRVLHGVENDEGWRTLKVKGVQDYYITNMGQVTEIETDNGINSPLVSLYHTDSVRCQLTGNFNQPLLYTPLYGEEQLWNRGEFYRIASMQNPDEKYHSLGYSAVHRCLKVAQIMIALIEYDIEKLNSYAPNGFIFIESDSMTSEQLDIALQEHKKVQIQQTGNTYFDRAMIMVDRAIKGDILALSELPDAFDPFQFTDYMMKAYALCFGRDARAFWSFNSGSFGAGKEAEIEAERATQAGYADYLSQDQEQLQKILPASVLFQYEEDDTNAKLLQARLLEAWSRAAMNLKSFGMSNDDIMGMMVKEKIIDPEFAPNSRTEVMTDEENHQRVRKEQLLENEQVQLAVQRYSDEPIIEYSSDSNRTRVLWKKGSDAIKNYHHVNWVSKKRVPKGSRQQGIVKQTADPKTFNKIVELGINQEIEQSDFEDRVINYQLAAMVENYYEQSTTEENRTGLEELIYLAAVAFLVNPALTSTSPLSSSDSAQQQMEQFNLSSLELTLPTPVFEAFDNKLSFGELSSFPDKVYSGYYEDAPESSLDNSILLWLGVLALATNLGKIYRRGDIDTLVSWLLGATEKHCETCAAMAALGQMTLQFWQEQSAAGIFPQSSGLECRGLKCDCSYSN